MFICHWRKEYNQKLLQQTNFKMEEYFLWQITYLLCTSSAFLSYFSFSIAPFSSFQSFFNFHYYLSVCTLLSQCVNDGIFHCPLNFFSGFLQKSCFPTVPLLGYYFYSHDVPLLLFFPHFSTSAFYR